MEWKRRLSLSLAVLALIVAIAACGGQPAEEPAAEEPAAEEPAAEDPAATEPETPAPVTPAEEPASDEPQEPELVGEINISDYNLEWGEPTAEEAPYEWWVTVQNDTTQTLDITVMFDVLDANGEVVKSERGSIRLDPAERGTIREPGTMAYDNANRVSEFAVDYEWEIVEG